MSALLHQLYLDPWRNVRRRISRLTFPYKVLHEHVAVSPDHLDLILADRPVRGTVTKQRLKILRCSTTQFQKSFVPRTITQWNTLPDSITPTASVSASRSQPSSVTHLVAVMSLWRLATTFQIQIQTERENSEMADRQTDRHRDRLNHRDYDAKTFLSFNQDTSDGPQSGMSSPSRPRTRLQINCFGSDIEQLTTTSPLKNPRHWEFD